MQTTLWILGVLVIVLAIAYGVFTFYQKRNLEQFFNQLYQETKAVPAKKKNSFLLFMFKETLQNAGKKNSQEALAAKFQNPKYLELQLIQMSNILKDVSKVQDKKMKKALAMYDRYLLWEKEKKSKKEA